VKNLEYKIPIPYFYWEFADRNQQMFADWVRGYLETNHPGLKPVRVKKYYYVVCMER
jgi:hypothetical protein